MPLSRLKRNDSEDEDIGSIRTLRGFSLDAQEKLAGEKWFDIYEDYWATPDYADVFTSAACTGVGAFEGATEQARAFGCLRGAV